MQMVVSSESMISIYLFSCPKDQKVVEELYFSLDARRSVHTLHSLNHVTWRVN